MAKINDLVKQVGDPRLRRELEAAVAELLQKKRFGLVYENHLPETTALPGFPVTEGAFAVRRDKISARHALRVCAVADGVATVEPLSGGQTEAAPVADLVALQRLGEPIYPGLERVGATERGGAARPHHAVIDGENYHVLKTLTLTHTGKVDVIYIDPPYNTGARDWKYNNDYVEADDLYRHSKWLAMMERRLRLAKELLNPADSVLIVAIDEKEYLRLGLLLEQVFPEATIQMVSSVINPAGAGREADFSRTDEYLFFARFGIAKVAPESRVQGETSVIWDSLRRSSLAGKRGRKGPGACGPNQFFPIYVDPKTGMISEIGEPIPEDVPLNQASVKPDNVTVLPIRPDGTEMNWGITPSVAKRLLINGYLRAGRAKPNEPQKYVISYLTLGIVEDIRTGMAIVRGKNPDGTVDAFYPAGRDKMPTTNWNRPSHDAQQYGTKIVNALLDNRPFPYPKSLYAIEDALRFFVANKPDAVILDFFAGSGTTTHAVMRLNKQYGGRRQCISVTNNEVSAGEQKALRAEGLLPGDPDWERWGIFEYITKPRIEAAVTGKTPNGQFIQGDYKFNDEFPMADGFAENVSFFHLNYLNPDQVDMGRQFAAIAPLLWLDSGAVGPYDPDADADGAGYSLPVGAKYAVLFRESCIGPFLEALAERPDISHVSLVTNREDAYAQMRAALPPHLHTRRLYRDYLRSFQLTEPE